MDNYDSYQDDEAIFRYFVRYIYKIYWYLYSQSFIISLFFLCVLSGFVTLSLRYKYLESHRKNKKININNEIDIIVVFYAIMPLIISIILNITERKINITEQLLVAQLFALPLHLIAYSTFFSNLILVPLLKYKLPLTLLIFSSIYLLLFIIYMYQYASTITY